SPFSSLAYRDYRYLWVGILSTSAGQWIEQVTLSWLVYDLTGSALLVGLLNGLRAIPFLVFGPFGGVAADRFNTKKLLIGCQALLMGLSAVLGFLIVSDLVQIWHLFAFTFFAGTAWSFSQPVRQAIVPSLVPGKALTNALALSSTAFNISRIIGPTIGGVLIVFIGAGGNFFVEALAYLFVIYTTSRINIPPGPGKSRGTSITSNLVEGLRYVRHHELVLPIMVMALIPQVFAQQYATLLPIFAKDVFAMGPEGFGLLASAPGVGALIGTLALASLGNYRRKGILMLGLGLTLGASFIALGFSNWLPLSLFLLAGLGGSISTYNTTNNTILQMIVPDALRGRVMSIYMLDRGLAPLGSLTAGAIAGFAGAPVASQFLGVCIFLMAFLALIKLPRIRKLEL
ncbi:MAG: MFS transporter, partial [Dehalococcoidia bacterium]|nr:MFS transporter [Dehalococcoidia bacterium]